jgi:adenylate kinase family enzyme
MRVQVTAPTGSGKTTLASELGTELGLRHVELDALYHRPRGSAGQFKAKNAPGR